VFVSAYLLLLATFGLVWLLAYLREVTFARPADAWLGRIFRGIGLCAAASIGVGWSLILGPPIATAFGGHGVTVAPDVTYVMVEMARPQSGAPVASCSASLRRDEYGGASNAPHGVAEWRA
jgi:hypothetical protein